MCIANKAIRRLLLLGMILMFGAHPAAAQLIRIDEQSAELGSALERLAYVPEGEGPALYIFEYSANYYCKRLYEYTRGKDLGVQLRHVFINATEPGAIDEMAVLAHTRDIKDYHAFMKQEKKAPPYITNHEVKESFYAATDVLIGAVMPILKENGVEELPTPAFIWERNGKLFFYGGYSDQYFDWIVGLLQPSADGQAPASDAK